MIYNSETKKLLKVGGNDGKKVLVGYRRGGVPPDARYCADVQDTLEKQNAQCKSDNAKCNSENTQ